MDIRQIIKWIGGLAGASFLCSSSCVKSIGRDCSETSYSFELPFKARPDTDSVRLGDEITFTVDCATVFTDISSGARVDYSGAVNLGSALYFVKYDSSERGMKNAADQFTYNVVKGTAVRSADSTLYREYLFAEFNNRYIFELIIKPKSPGLYRVVFSNSANTYRRNDPCTKAGFAINLAETAHNRRLEGVDDEATPGGDFHFHVSP